MAFFFVFVSVLYVIQGTGGERFCFLCVYASECAVKCDMFVCVGVAKCVTNTDGIDVKCIHIFFHNSATHTHTHTHKVNNTSPGTKASFHVSAANSQEERSSRN
jgi:hypothetical protein